MISRALRAAAKLLVTEAGKSAATSIGTQVGTAIGKRISARIYVEPPSPAKESAPSAEERR